MPTKIFTATLPGKCAIGGEEIQGKRVLYNKEKKLVCADHMWPDKAGKKVQANPESSKPAAPTKAAETTVGGFDRKANLKEAIEDLKTINGGSPLQYHELLGLQNIIAELMREKHFEYSNAKITELELKKIKAYGKV